MLRRPCPARPAARRARRCTHGVRNHQRGLRRRDARGPGGSGARRPAAAERRLGRAGRGRRGWLGDRAESAIARPLAQRPWRGPGAERADEAARHAHRDGRAAFSALDPAFGEAAAVGRPRSRRLLAGCVGPPGRGLHRRAAPDGGTEAAAAFRSRASRVRAGRRSRFHRGAERVGARPGAGPVHPHPQPGELPRLLRGGSAAGAAGRRGCGRGRAAARRVTRLGPSDRPRPPRGEGPPHSAACVSGARLPGRQRTGRLRPRRAVLLPP